MFPQYQPVGVSLSILIMKFCQIHHDSDGITISCYVSAGGRMFKVHITENDIPRYHGKILNLGIGGIVFSVYYKFLIAPSAHIIACEAEHFAFWILARDKLRLSRLHQIAVVALSATGLIHLLLEGIDLTIGAEVLHGVALRQFRKEINRALDLLGRRDEDQAHGMPECEGKDIIGYRTVADHQVTADVLHRGRLILLWPPLVHIFRKELSGRAFRPVYLFHIKILVVGIIGEIAHAREIVEGLTIGILPVGAVIYQFQILIV